MQGDEWGYCMGGQQDNEICEMKVAGEGDECGGRGEGMNGILLWWSLVRPGGNLFM